MEAVTATIDIEENGHTSRDIHLHFTSYGFTSIVHETHHATFRVLDWVGMKLTEETIEAYAYYQDWLAGAIRDQFEIWTKQDKRKGRK